MKTFITAALFAAVLTTAPVLAEVHSIDASHSEVSFQLRHLVTQVRGNFNDYEGTINLDPANLEKSSVDFRIKAASTAKSSALPTTPPISTRCNLLRSVIASNAGSDDMRICQSCPAMVSFSTWPQREG